MKTSSDPIIVCRMPLLVQGQCGVDQNDNVYIFIDSEQSERQQNITLWHEVLHLLGIKNEERVEDMAKRLAAGCPEAWECVKIAQGIRQ